MSHTPPWLGGPKRNVLYKITSDGHGNVWVVDEYTDRSSHIFGPSNVEYTNEQFANAVRRALIQFMQD